LNPKPLTGGGGALEFLHAPVPLATAAAAVAMSFLLTLLLQVV